MGTNIASRPSLSSLADWSGSPSDGQFVRWDAASGKFKPTRQRDLPSAVFDIRDYGAVPGIGGARATRDAIQAALDAASAVDGDVLIPAGIDWYINRNIMVDMSNAAIVGERTRPRPASGITGTCPSRITVLGGFPAFVVGIPRAWPNTAGNAALTLDATYFPDLFGKLDTSAASSTGRRWGWKSNGNSYIVAGTGHFQHTGGDYWSTVRKLTVDIAFDIDYTTAKSILWGSNDAQSNAPITLTYTPGASPYIAVSFSTMPTGSDPLTTAPTQRSFRVPMPTGLAGTCRITVQIDLDGATQQGWINGVQKTLTNVATGADWLPGAAISFPENCQFVFKTLAGSKQGSVSPRSATFYASDSPYQLALYGVSMSRATRYEDDGAGFYQRRLGQGTASNVAPPDAGLTDAVRYFSQDASTVGYFPFQDDPAVASLDRMLTVKGGSNASHTSGALVLNYTNQDPHFGNVKGVSFRDLQIATNTLFSGFAGVSILRGYNTGTTYDRLRIDGPPAQALGSWGWGTEYVTLARDCTLEGSDAAVYSSGVAMLILQDTSFPSHGRATVWSSGGVTQLRGHCFGTGFTSGVSGTPVVPRWVICGQAGADIEWDWFGVDLEDAAPKWPKSAWCYMENTQQQAIPGKLRAKGPGFVFGPPDAPLYWFHSVPGGQPATAEIDLIAAGSTVPLGTIRLDGDGWSGTYRTNGDEAGSPRLELVGANAGGVVVEERRIVLPRRSKWYTGQHRFLPPTPAPGQVAEWAVAGTGRFGTATPPTFVPVTTLDPTVGPMSTGSLALAAYLLDHGWLSCSQAGLVAREGMLGDTPSAAFLAWLLAGSAITPPAALKVAMATKPNVGMTYFEMRNLGYARVQALGGGLGSPVWNACSGGSATTGAAFSFPTATADWSPLYSLMFVDGTSGVIYASLNLDQFTVASGSVLTLAAGSLTVSHGAAGPYRAMSDTYRDKLVNFALRGTSPGTAPTLYAALSTARADVTASPTEPSGNGYARVALSTAAMSAASAANTQRSWRNAVSTNGSALTFGSPTGSWGTIKSIYLMDAATAGNVVMAGNLVTPRSPVAGDPAPSFAPGALWVGRS